MKIMSMSLLFLGVFLVACTINPGPIGGAPNVGTTVYSVSGTLSGNSFGLPLGVAVVVYNPSSNSVKETVSITPSAVESFAYDIQYHAVSGDIVYVVYYMDENSSGKHEWSSSGLKTETSVNVTNFVFSNTNITLDMPLVGKVAKGNVSGSDAGFFQKCYVNVWKPPFAGAVCGIVSGANYEVRYYLLSGSGTYSNAAFIARDMNADGHVDDGEPAIEYTNKLIMSATAVTTNASVDFSIQKNIIQLAIDPSSDDYAFLKFQNGSSAVSSPYDITNYKFSGNDVEYVSVMPFFDSDGNSSVDPDRDVAMADMLAVSNQAVETRNYVIRRCVIGITTGTNYGGYTAPKIYFEHNQLMRPIVYNAMTVTNYYITNMAISEKVSAIVIEEIGLGLYVYNGIATNDASWAVYLPSTNFTIDITN